MKVNPIPQMHDQMTEVLPLYKFVFISSLRYNLDVRQSKSEGVSTSLSEE